MPLDLPISWASHLALIFTGTSDGVFKAEGLSSGSTSEFPWARDLMFLSLCHLFHKRE